MKAHTSGFKNEIKTFGREFDDIVTYDNVTLTSEDINSVVIRTSSSIMKSVMKELDLDSNVMIPKGTVINYRIGLKVNNSYEYLDYGNFVVDSIESQEDKKSYLIKCFDKMLYSMVDYQAMNQYSATQDTTFEEDKVYYEIEDNEVTVYDGEITGNPQELGLLEDTTYPVTVREFINRICVKLGITFANANDTFINYDKTIPSELYLDESGNSLGYTYRAVLDELAQVTGSFICINNDDELEVRYITEATEEIVGEGSVSIGDEYEFTREITNNHQYVICNTNEQTANTINSEVGNTILNSGTPTDNVWLFSESESGYTILNTVTNKYLGYVMRDQVNVTLGCYDEPTIWTWNSSNGRLSITTTGLFSRTWYLRYNNGWQLTVNTSNTSLYLVDLGGGTVIQRDTINEEYFNDINVNIGKKYGPINSLVFSRSADSDNIGLNDLSSITLNGLCELKITDNQILNDNNRDEFLDDLFEYLNGLYYYLNDYDSKGILYYEIGDMYNVSIGENSYQCLLLNDEINRTQGLKETIYSVEPETTVSDYKAMSKSDKTINKTYLIVNKQEGKIESLVSKTNTIDTQEKNNYLELNGKFDNYTPKSQFATLENSVTTLQTDTYTKTDVQSILKGTFYDENNNQIVSEIVQTTSGTFDENGMTYEKTNANTKTTINEVGVGVKKTDGSDDYILFAGYVNSGNTQFGDFEGQTVVASDNLIVQHYLVVGQNSRMEDYENGTGMFYIGG